MCSTYVVCDLVRNLTAHRHEDGLKFLVCLVRGNLPRGCVSKNTISSRSIHFVGSAYRMSQETPTTSSPIYLESVQLEVSDRKYIQQIKAPPLFYRPFWRRFDVFVVENSKDKLATSTSSRDFFSVWFRQGALFY